MPDLDLDILVVGSGPAGIAAAGTLNDAGYRTACYDKGSLAQAVTQWPIYMRFFSTAANVELPGFPLILTEEKPTREEYLNYLRRYVLKKNITVVTGRRVDSIERLTKEAGRQRDAFAVSGEDEWGAKFTISTRFVIVATGAYEIPKLLNVPGEDLHKVSHYYKEVHPYVGKKVAVVGGRNGAAEAALLLWRAGAEVTLIYRGKKLMPLKWWLHPDLENRIAQKEIQAWLDTTVLEILPRSIIIQKGSDNAVTLPNDFVVAMTGYRPDTSLLANAGVFVDAETNRPAINKETLETNVLGLYVAGVIAAGDISNEIFIENSRDHGQMILQSIVEKLNRTQAT